MASLPTGPSLPIRTTLSLWRLLPTALLLSLLGACSGGESHTQAAPIQPAPTPQRAAPEPAATQAASPVENAAGQPKPQPAQAPPGAKGDEAVAIFAGGCFWCMEPPYDKLPGVISTTSGYTGGKVSGPTYEQVSAGGTGHAEAVLVRYDPGKIGYQQLLDVFWKNIDPLEVDRQFCDVGDQYRSAIFTSSARQRKLAEASKQSIESSGRFQQPIATQIVDASTFYPAEDYHQDYYEKNPVQYKFYRFNCGRDQRLKELWGKR